MVSRNGSTRLVRAQIWSRARSTSLLYLTTSWQGAKRRSLGAIFHKVFCRLRMPAIPLMPLGGSSSLMESDNLPNGRRRFQRGRNHGAGHPSAGLQCAREPARQPASQFAWSEDDFLYFTEGSPIRHICHERWPRNFAGTIPRRCKR